MQRSTIEQRVKLALRSLGETAEDIATALEVGGWLGLRNNAGACPVALYLSTVMPNVTGAAVGSDQATVHLADGTDIEVDLPSAVAGFVLAFDNGSYPDVAVQDCDVNGDVFDDF